MFTKGALSELNTGAMYYNEKNGKYSVYHPNIIELLDSVFLNKFNYDFLSIEQERFIKRYANQANQAIQNIKDKVADPLACLDQTIKELDNFLGLCKIPKEINMNYTNPQEITLRFTEAITSGKTVDIQLYYTVGKNNLLLSKNGVVWYRYGNVQEESQAQYKEDPNKRTGEQSHYIYLLDHIDSGDSLNVMVLPLGE